MQSYRTLAETCWSATGNSERSTKKIGRTLIQNQKILSPLRSSISGRCAATFEGIAAGTSGQILYLHNASHGDLA